MNSEQDSLAGAIAAIGKPEFYDKLCSYFRTYVSYDNVIFITFDRTSLPIVDFKSHNGYDVFRYLDEKYLSGAYLLDPVYTYHLDKRGDDTFRLTDIAPDQFRRSHYFEWYYGTIGITDELTVLVSVGNGISMTVSLGKDKTSSQMFLSRDETQMRKRQTIIIALLKAHWDCGGAKLSLGKKKPQAIVDGLIHLMQTRHGLKLTWRQAEVAMLILRGHSSISIGMNLNISVETVKVFRKQLYQKCQISSQAELFTLMMPLLAEISATAQPD